MTTPASGHARLLAAGRLDDAASAAGRVLAETPGDPGALSTLGVVAFRQGRFDEALARHGEAVAAAPDRPGLLARLAVVHVARNELDEALRAYDRALVRDPDHAASIAGVAEVHWRRGATAAARALLGPVAQRRALTPKMTLVLARVLHDEGRDDEVERLVAATDASALGPFARPLFLLLGRTLERTGRFDEAFDAYRRGNALADVPFRLADVQARFILQRKVFARDADPAVPRGTSTAETPVLVVSLPRSGSTLVEQILHAHPEAHGAGEVSILPRVIAALPGVAPDAGAYPLGLRRVDAAAMDALAARYLEPLAALAPEARRIVDKSLETFEHLGLVDRMLPRARVIVVRRDPLDACFSGWTQDLWPQLHPYASDLRDLGRYARAVDDLLGFWRETLDLAMLEVRYETLVSEPEAGSRRIVAFTGLDWHDACLRPHEARRDVGTISHEQVRRPITGTAVGRAARFGALVDPLREALAD